MNAAGMRCGQHSSRPLRVTVAIIVIAAMTGCADRHADAPRSVGWHQTHQVQFPAGWKLDQRNVNPAESSTSISGPNNAGCLISSSPDKPPRSMRPRHSQTVTVQGTTARYGELHPDYGPYRRAVLWQSTDDQWFRVSCDLDQAGILQIAERVRPGTTRMYVPFRLTDLPDQVSTVELIESVDGERRTTTAVFEARRSAESLTMEISNPPDRWYAQGPVGRREIRGRTAEIRTGTQTICLLTESVPICVSGPGSEPAGDWLPWTRRVALQTARALIPVDDPGNESSWIDADRAFPD